MKLLPMMAALVAASTMSSCSVFMAANQPSAKDLSVLKVGTPRDQVIAELGAPIHSEGPVTAQKDVYSFVQGYSSINKVGRATTHAIGDIMTLGLWEIVGTPAEAIANGTEIKTEVLYDKNVRVKEVTPYKGGHKIEKALQ